MDSLLDQALEILRNYVDVEFHGNKFAASKALGLKTNGILNKWLKGERKPTMALLSPILEQLGATLTLPSQESSKDVVFVDAKVVPAGDGTAPPEAEGYIAAPVVGEVGAGPGYLPQETIKSWFLAYKNLPAIRHRRNLIAVEIGPSSTSMMPTLNPMDIVLVDRDDRAVDRPGHIMLVLDPDDGSGMVKRVSTQEVKGDIQITYYSDNAAKWPPMIYGLNSDFNGDWDKAIVGRVIWAWKDMREM